MERTPRFLADFRCGRETKRQCSGLRREATMPERRRARLWVAGGLGCAVVGAAVWFGYFARSRGTAAGGSSLTINEASPLPVLNQGLRDSDPRALAVFQQRVTPKPDAPRTALTAAEAGQWL